MTNKPMEHNSLETSSRICENLIYDITGIMLSMERMDNSINCTPMISYPHGKN